MERLFIFHAHRFGNGRFGFVGILLDEVHRLGERGDHALHGFGALAQHFVVGEQGAVDEGNFEIDQPVDNIKAVVFGADIQRRCHEDRLNDVSDHGLIALRLAAADGMYGNFIGR